jgi:hypothetical protein
VNAWQREGSIAGSRADIGFWRCLPGKAIPARVSGKPFVGSYPIVNLC